MVAEEISSLYLMLLETRVNCKTIFHPKTPRGRIYSYKFKGGIYSYKVEVTFAIDIFVYPTFFPFRNAEKPKVRPPKQKKNPDRHAVPVRALPFLWSRLPIPFNAFQRVSPGCRNPQES